MIAPRKFLTIAFAAIYQAEATVICPYPSTAGFTTDQLAEEYRSWFVGVARVAQQAVINDDDTFINDFDTKIPAPPASLTSALGDEECKAKLEQLTKDILANLKFQKQLGTRNPGYNCPTEPWTADMESIWLDYKCTRLMAGATDAFNKGAFNGYDVVTGLAYRRMTIQQYVDIEKRFQPYNPIVVIAAKYAAVADANAPAFEVWSAEIPILIGTESFSTVLNAAVAPLVATYGAATASYKTCFTGFYDALRLRFQDAEIKSEC